MLKLDVKMNETCDQNDNLELKPAIEFPDLPKLLPDLQAVSQLEVPDGLHHHVFSICVCFRASRFAPSFELRSISVFGFFV